MNRRRLAGLGLLALVITVACGDGSDAPARIVVVTFDTTRADRFGCYGADRGLTPNVDRFAAGAVLFEHAVSAVPTTLPSHSTMFTGLYPHDHGVRYNIVFRLGDEAFTLAEALKQNGYTTAAFPSSFILAQRFGLNQGFDSYSEPPRPKKEERQHSEAVMRPAGEGVDLALDWLAQHSDEKTFVWLHFYDPHAPYTPPFPYSSQYRERPYDGEIAYTDAQFGRLLDALEQDPQWERTLVVVAADHGEGLHDHRERYHSYLTYESTQHVPFIVRSPGGGASRVDEPVALADLMPTVLDLAGIEPPPDLRGISLAAAFRGQPLPRRDIYFESVAGALNYGWAEVKGVRDGRWKLIDSAQPELYDLERDPDERTNLAGLEPERLQELRGALQALAEPLGADAAVEAQDPVMDAETEAFLASLGYVGGGAGSSAANAVHPRDVIDLDSEMMQARRSIAAKQWKVVEGVCRYVLDRDASNKWGLKTITMALGQLGRAREGQDFAAEYVGLYPDDPNGYALLAETYQNQGRTDLAMKTLHQGLTAVPGSERLTYLTLVVGIESGRESACSDDVPAAVAEFPASSRMLIMQARCEVRDSEPEQVLQTLRTAVEFGFRDFDLIVDSPEFSRVAALSGFAELREATESDAGSGPPDSPGDAE